MDRGKRNSTSKLDERDSKLLISLSALQERDAI